MIALGIMTTIMVSAAILLPFFSSLAVAVIIGFTLNCGWNCSGHRGFFPKLHQNLCGFRPIRVTILNNAA